MNGIFISTGTLDGATPAFRAEAAILLGFGTSRSSLPDDQSVDGRLAESAERFGFAQMRAFIDGCGEKTIDALRAIAEAGPSFRISDLEAQLGTPKSGLRGVWTGLTKRARTISGNPEANLIAWYEEGDTYRGYLAPETLAALVEIMGL